MPALRTRRVASMAVLLLTVSTAVAGAQDEEPAQTAPPDLGLAGIVVDAAYEEDLAALIGSIRDAEAGDNASLQEFLLAADGMVQPYLLNKYVAAEFGLGDVPIEWSMPPRYDLSWEMYDPAKRRYRSKQVDPDKWTINLDACATPGGTFEWSMESLSGAPEVGGIDGVCNPEIELDELGTYEVTVKVDSGTSLGRSGKVRITPRDILIVSIGDSYASGEGNPDERIVAENVCEWSGVMFDPPKCEYVVHQDVEWVDDRCHRSKLSAPALAAQTIEDVDDHSSVTFLSLACTGATFKNQQAVKSALDQVTAVAESICGDAPCTDDDRTVDALLVSVGGNDMGFAEALIGCIHGGCVTPGEIRAKLADPAGIIRCDRSAACGSVPALDDRITNQLNVANHSDIYITEYPTHLFADRNGKAKSCDIFNASSDKFFKPIFNPLGLNPLFAAADFFGIDIQIDLFRVTPNEARDIRDSAALLNEALAGAAAEHGWTYIGNIASMFEHHGYCSGKDNRWFVRLGESVEGQGDLMGTMHPNQRGHQRIADLIEAALISDQPSETYEIVVHSVSVTDDWTDRFTEERLGKIERRDFLVSTDRRSDAGFSVDPFGVNTSRQLSTEEPVEIPVWPSAGQDLVIEVSYWRPHPFHNTEPEVIECHGVGGDDFLLGPGDALEFGPVVDCPTEVGGSKPPRTQWRNVQVVDRWGVETGYGVGRHVVEAESNDGLRIDLDYSIRRLDDVEPIRPVDRGDSSPVHAVNDFLDIVAAKDYVQLADISCQAERDAIAAQFDLAGMTGLEEFAVDSGTRSIVDAINVGIDERDVTLVEQAGDSAVVRVDAAMSVGVAEEFAPEFVRAALTANGGIADEATVQRLASAVAGQLAEPIDIERDVRVEREGDRWLLCDSFSDG